MEYQEFATAWDAIAETPEEAANLKARAQLMRALEKHIAAKGWTQTEAARHLGITQPRVSDLMRTKIEHFGLDLLVQLVARAGMALDLRVITPGKTPARRAVSKARETAA
jgi:predicted XRE-type DNA-binding protein